MFRLKCESLIIPEPTGKDEKVLVNKKLTIFHIYTYFEIYELEYYILKNLETMI